MAKSCTYSLNIRRFFKIQELASYGTRLHVIYTVT